MSKSELQYEWNDEMDEVSGLGGEYEEACREMIAAGLQWLEDNDGPVVKFSGGQNVTARIGPAAGEIDDLREHMASVVEFDVTPSMLHVCVKHALYAYDIGWLSYTTRMEDRYRD